MAYVRKSRRGNTSVDYPEEPVERFIIGPKKEARLPTVKIVNATEDTIVIRRWRNLNDPRPFVEIVGKLVPKM